MIRWNPLEMDILIGVTYGGILGRLVRRLGYRWNHILLFIAPKGTTLPIWTYESNGRGVHDHLFQAEDYAEEYELYEPAVPLTPEEKLALVAFADGNVGKFYGLWYWAQIAWRILKDIWHRREPGRAVAFLRPGETCISFVHRCGAYVGRPISPSSGEAGLPDDIMHSPHWRKVSR